MSTILSTHHFNKFAGYIGAERRMPRYVGAGPEMCGHFGAKARMLLYVGAEPHVPRYVGADSQRRGHFGAEAQMQSRIPQRFEDVLFFLKPLNPSKIAKEACSLYSVDAEMAAKVRVFLAGSWCCGEHPHCV